MDELEACTSGTPSSSSKCFGFRWTDELVGQLIQWRGENELSFTGRRNTAIQGFEAFVSSHGLQGKISAAHVKKKWENLKLKYKDFKCPKTEVGAGDGQKWKWFQEMDSIMGDKPLISRLFLTSVGQESVLTSVPVLTSVSSVDFLPMSDEEDVAPAPPTQDVAAQDVAAQDVATQYVATQHVAPAPQRKRKREEGEVVTFLQDMQRREEEARVKEEQRYEEARAREEARYEDARRRDERRDEEARRREERRDEEARRREERRDEEERKRAERQEERDERFMLLLAALAKK